MDNCICLFGLIVIPTSLYLLYKVWKGILIDKDTYVPTYVPTDDTEDEINMMLDDY